MRPLVLSIWLMNIFFLLSPSFSTAKLYRWVDAEGISHVSNRPPVGRLAETKNSSEDRKAEPEKSKLYDFREKVVNVVGADTIELESGKLVKYIGVKSPFGYLDDTGRKGRVSEVKIFHNKLVRGKVVTVLLGKKRKDRKGRYLGHVFLGQQAFVNAELIRQGYALTEEYPSDYEYQSLFVRLLKDAQKNRRGLWDF